MEIVNNLETILEKQDEVAKQAETDKVVEAAVAEKPSEMEERVKNWRCPICKRGYQPKRPKRPKRSKPFPVDGNPVQVARVVQLGIL